MLLPEASDSQGCYPLGWGSIGSAPTPRWYVSLALFSHSSPQVALRLWDPGRAGAPVVHGVGSLVRGVDGVLIANLCSTGPFLGHVCAPHQLGPKTPALTASQLHIHGDIVIGILRDQGQKSTTRTAPRSSPHLPAPSLAQGLPGCSHHGVLGWEQLAEGGALCPLVGTRDLGDRCEWGGPLTCPKEW